MMSGCLYQYSDNLEEEEMAEKMTVAILGLGSRGLQVYAPIIEQNAEKMELTAVADLMEEKVEEAKTRYHLKAENCFYSAEELLSADRLADVMFICTQDRDHVKHAVEAIKKGYHLLLEKPVSPDEEECRLLLETAREYQRKVCVCHVLRYTPFYSKIKEMLLDGAVGKVMNIQAREDVGFFHQAHSFVRGNWRDSRETSPMILAKCCHDMDILVWLSDSGCSRVSSFGELSWFKEENAPKGAAKRCMSGCGAKEDCPYDAEKIYITDKSTGVRHGAGWPANTFVIHPTEDAVREALEKGPYGRCVYHCDNDVVDHQVVNLQMENGITVTFSMCAFSATCNRTIKIMGTLGQIEGDMGKHMIYYTPFGKKTEEIDLTKLTEDFSGHGGGDVRMVQQFCDYIMKGKESPSITDLGTSLESHYIALAAEKSRLENGSMISLKESACGQ